MVAVDTATVKFSRDRSTTGGVGVISVATDVAADGLAAQASSPSSKFTSGGGGGSAVQSSTKFTTGVEISQYDESLKHLEIGHHVILYGKLVFRGTPTNLIEIRSISDINILDDIKDEDDIPVYMITPSKIAKFSKGELEASAARKKLKMDTE
ncbi:hypothetical protein QAD02_009974 [Eretmocerus hayati]|uniref:Uncharacterized protein n=1 Tax=Eretmocerus hayati TaxID=131215 RepID=A0ACC2NBM7_9HYME|nr:hypothetical protein QAD02_009974 [Eretmocerus hayati]